MSGYDRAQQCIDKTLWIRDWASAIYPSDGPHPPTATATATATATETATTTSAKKGRLRRSSESSQPDYSDHPPAKRVKFDLGQQLCTPPPDTMSDASGCRKRPRDADVGMDKHDFETPKASRSQQTAFRRSHNRSPHKRRQPPSKLKLVTLEKPVRDEAVQEQNLPPDVASLDAQLQNPSRCASDIPDTDPRLQQLHEVVLDAREASRLLAHEVQFTHTVQTPLLRLVFHSRRPTAKEAKDLLRLKQRARARWLPAMTATISGEYIPSKRRPQMPHTSEVSSANQASAAMSPSLACSVSTDSVASSIPLPSEGQTDNVDITHVHSRTYSRKVDYVLAVDATDGTPLHDWLHYLSTADAFDTDRLPHVNQTKYGPLMESPIACSIETKLQSATDDGLNQLGMWTVAWHKKMASMRDFLARERERRPNVHDRIPSALVIKAVGDEWDLFYVGDNGTSVTLHGPVRLGSTINVTQTRILLRSLDLIKEWTETTFMESVERWLLW